MRSVVGVYEFKSWVFYGSWGISISLRIKSLYIDCPVILGCLIHFLLLGLKIVVELYSNKNTTPAANMTFVTDAD